MKVQTGGVSARSAIFLRTSASARYSLERMFFSPAVTPRSSLRPFQPLLFFSVSPLLQGIKRYLSSGKNPECQPSKIGIRERPTYNKEKDTKMKKFVFCICEHCHCKFAADTRHPNAHNCGKDECRREANRKCQPPRLLSVFRANLMFR